MKYLIFVLLCVGMIHCQASQLQVIKALNLARTNPKILAGWIDSQYISQGKNGIANDEDCYKEAFNYYNNLPPVSPLSEDAGADLAAYTHALDQVTSGTFSQTASDAKTTPTDTLNRFGKFAGSWSFTQMAALFERSTAVPANDVIMLFATSCGDKTRKYRSLLFSTTYTQIGVGVYNRERKTMFTVIFLKGFTRAPISNEQLNAALIEGDGMYTGSGASFPTAVFRPIGTDARPITLPQIHTQQKIEATDDTTGELGNLTDDGSIKCPTQINHNVYSIRDLKPWTKTSQKCTRGQGDFTTPDFLDRKKPFAQKGKCYHRFRYCGSTGAVYVYDRQYKTLDDANKPLSDVKNELLDGKSDATVVCPRWVSPSLRIRLVTNWYLITTEKCTRGSNGYATNGIRRDDPFAKRGRCYHRQLFCDERGQVWAKDSEYLTYSTWAALKRK